MAKIVNLGRHNQKSLQECQDNGIPPGFSDPPTGYCNTDEPPNFEGWLEDVSNKKIGIGHQNQCDPMQTGDIINPVESGESTKNDGNNDRSGRDVIYRYSKALRGADEAMLDMFRNLVVINEDGQAIPVPIVWSPPERAVAAIIQSNFRKDNSLVVDRIKLPMLAMQRTDLQFAQQRYTYHRALNFMNHHRDDEKPGFAIKEKYERDTVFGVARGIPIDASYSVIGWTMYHEDMNQIIEQVLTKFSPVAYIKVRGVTWETIVRLDAIGNNTENEPGESRRVIKFQFNMTAETYIPQPIVRRKSVLKIKTNIFNSTDPKMITEAIDRLEDAVEELSDV